MPLSQADRNISKALQPIAESLDELLQEIGGQRMSFMLVVFQSEDNSRSNYVSNCTREDVVGAIKSLLEQWGDGLPDVASHEIN